MSEILDIMVIQYTYETNNTNKIKKGGKVMKLLTDNSKIALGFGTVLMLEAAQAIVPNAKPVCRAGEAVIGAALIAAYMLPSPSSFERKEA